MPRGSVIERNGSWRLRVSMGREETTGKYINHFETCRTKKDAERRLAQILHEKDKGVFVPPAKITVKEHLESWLEEVCYPHLSPTTFKLYSGIVHNHLVPAFGSITISELKPPAIQKFLANKQKDGLSPRTIQIIRRSVLGNALSNAIKLGILARNPVDGTESPKITRHQFSILDENMIALIQSLLETSEYQIYFITMLHTGMRRSEALALKWTDVDLNMMQLFVSKSLAFDHERHLISKSTKTAKGKREISLTPTNALALREHYTATNIQRTKLGLPALVDSDYIFAHWDGTPLLPESVTRYWIRLMRRLGFKGVRLHDIRHTHASILLKAGVHPKIVQERLGHASIAITLDLYSHVAPGLQEAAAMKFDELIKKQMIQISK